MWQQNIQGAGTYRSGTGYGCPHTYTVPIIICHQSPLVRYWSCNNINQHTLGTRTYLSGSGFRFPIILSPIYTCLGWSCLTKQDTLGASFCRPDTGYTCPLNFFAIILSLGPTGPVLFMWQDIDIHGVLAPTGMVLVKARDNSSKQNKYTGCQSLPVRYWVWLLSQIWPWIICHQCPPVWCLVIWWLK